MNNKTIEKVRIDKYLWSIRVFKTRSLATDACDSGKVKLNENAIKPSKNVSIGEIYDIKTKERRWLIQVVALLDKRQAYSEAIKYYKDLTPEEDKMNKDQQAASFYTGKRLSKIGRPTKKDRRGLDNLWEEL
jgi:ribosome-associated heat shock protein Hsp15